MNPDPLKLLIWKWIHVEIRSRLGRISEQNGVHRVVKETFRKGSRRKRNRVSIVRRHQQLSLPK